MLPYFVFNQISLGPVKIYTWGLLAGLAFTAGYFSVLYRAKKTNIPPTRIIWLALTIFAGAIIGSRLFYLLQTPADFLADISQLWSPRSGAMSFGGLIGGVFFAWVYLKIINSHGRIRMNLRYSHAKFWPIADLIAPAIALGMGIGRFGCLLINDHQGALTSLPWGILWPDNSLRHPVALYLILFDLLLFIFLLWREKKTKFTGELFLLFLLIFSAGRFLLDFTRQATGYFADPRYWLFSAGQWLAILIFITGLTFWHKKRRLIK